MENRYNPDAIEKKWQKIWEESGLYTVQNSVPGKENYYQLVEFSYPSGNLHVGHWYAFAVPDIHARFQRMKGKNVLYPMGFDAFGLPAENAAIKHNKNPRDWTYQNIEHMRKQLKSMGALFDWSREVITSDPEYYRWTQWLFIQLFKAGLVEQKETLANWCPQDKTVLANEQVVNNICERCGAAIEKKVMKQWQVKITDYADRLLTDLEALDWPEEIKTSQRNWIGKSEGAEIFFLLNFIYQPSANDNRGPNGEKAALPVFTTRPDTLFGATYLVLAPEHLWVSLALQEDHNVLENKEEIRTYVEASKKKSEIERSNTTREKTGVLVRGVTAINPATKEEIPIYVADYVLAGYGTGAIMAVPAHDERDNEFAKKFDLPIKQVIAPIYNKQKGEKLIRKAVYAVITNQKNEHLIQYYEKAKYHWLVGGGIDESESEEDCLRREIIEETGYTDFQIKERLGEVVFENIREVDGILRRTIGAIYEVELTSDKQIPVKFEQDEIKDGLTSIWVADQNLEKEFTRGREQRSAFVKQCLDLRGKKAILENGILTASKEFNGISSKEAKQKITEAVGGKLTNTYKLRGWGVSRQRYWGCPIPLVRCEQCGWQAVPDEQLPVVLPEVQDYLPNDEGQSPLSKNSDFVNTICPKCQGSATRETDTLDTFVDSSWYFLRYCDPKNEKLFAEKNILKSWMPVNLYSGGAEHTTLHLLYSRFFHKALFDLGLVNESEPYTRRLNRSLILGPDGLKMSKSKGNIIDPDAIVTELGADTVRMYLAFVGPYNEVSGYPWNPEGVIGVYRFLERVWKLTAKVSNEKNADNPSSSEYEKIESILQKTLLAVEESIASFKMNTGVAALMSCSNELKNFPILSPEHMRFYAQILAPYAPHIAEEIWSLCEGEGSVHSTEWPKYDDNKVVQGALKMAVQVNGKMRAVIEVNPDTTEEEIKNLALADEKVQAAISDQEIKKIIIIPKKIISIVV